MKLVINLNGNFCCPFQGLIDIAQQLPGYDPAFCGLAFSPICELKTTNDWINLESLGKPVAVRAETLLERLTDVLKRNHIREIELHINLYQSVLTSDNLYSFLLLAEYLTQLSIIFYTADESGVELDKSLSFLREKSNVTLQRQSYQQFTRETVLLEKSHKLAELRYKTLQNRGFDIHKETAIAKLPVGMVIGYAWLCLKAGAYELGCRILENALIQSDLAESVREQVCVNLQLIRFLSHQYKSVASGFPEDFPHLVESEAINMHFIKAYAATLDRNLSVAETYFDKAHIHSDAPMTDEASLYRLNNFALFLVLNGKIDEALVLEKRIEHYIEDKKIAIVGLKYVNFINIARLYKKLNQLNEAMHYYTKAYNEISEGGYTASDHIYYHLNLANLHEAAGEANAALMSWIKVGLYWMAFKNPHALSWRPRLILCQEKITDTLVPLSINKVNQFLYDRIQSAIQRAGFVFEDSTSDFNFILDEIKLDKTTCYVANDIILYNTQTEDSQPYKGMHGHELRKLLSNLVKKMMNIEGNPFSLIVDTFSENKYPQSAEAAIRLSLLSGCNACYYNGIRLNYSKENLTQKVTFSLSRLIESIQSTSAGLQLTFKRSFLNTILLAKDEIELVQNIGKKKLIELHLQDEAISPVLKLMRKKILTLLSQPMLQECIQENISGGYQAE